MKISIIIACLILVWAIYRHFRTRYIGFGWVLEYREDTHDVIVSSRLLNGPAGKVGINNNSILLEYDGVPMRFASEEEWAAFFANRPKLKPGMSRRFLLKQGDAVLNVEMKACVIHGGVPMYHAPTPRHQRKFDVVYGMGRCKKTGLLYETTRPNWAWSSLRGS